MSSTNPHMNSQVEKYMEFAREHLTSVELIQWGLDESDALEMTAALAAALRALDSGYVGTADVGLVKAFYSLDFHASDHFIRTILRSEEWGAYGG